MTEKILFVDDEPKILEAYRRTLRKSFQVVPAESGQQALELMASEGPFPVIVSDMQMPEMNGVELLTKVKALYPDTVRMMLTGNADQKTAVEAINTSDVYRFLNKPCPPDEMTAAISGALDFYQLLQTEKVLLESTVKGSIDALSEVLSLARPEVFGRITHIKSYAKSCAKIMGIAVNWELEAVALLCQMGLISMPESMVDRSLKGQLLSEEEQQIFNKHPEIAANLIANIPRMENVANAIRQQNNDYFRSGEPDKSLLPAARIVRPIIDLMNARASGLSLTEAFSLVSGRRESYDPAVIDALSKVVSNLKKGKVVEVNINQLKPGSVLAKNIVTYSGALLVEKGQQVNESLATRLINFWRNGEIDEQVCILVFEKEKKESAA